MYDGCETVQLLRHRELAQFEEEQEEDDEDWEEDDYFNSSEVSSLSAHSWIPLEEQTFYKNYYKAYQRMAARELRTREEKEKEKQQKEAENAHEVDPAIDTCVDSSIKVELGAFPSETAADVVVAFEHPASEQLGDTLDVQRPLDDNIVLHDTSPPENNDQEEAGKHMGGETGACSNVVVEVAPPTESEIIAPAAQKQPLRRQLVVGMSDSNDESTRRKALECGTVDICTPRLLLNIISHYFSLVRRYGRLYFQTILVGEVPTGHDFAACPSLPAAIAFPREGSGGAFFHLQNYC